METTWKTSELAHLEHLGLNVYGKSDTPLDEVKRLRTQLQSLHTKIQLEELEQIELNSRRTEGTIRIVYENYRDTFALQHGTISIFSIDDEYCLSDVMPGCVLELVHFSPKERIEKEIKHEHIPFVIKDSSRKNWIELYTYAAEPKTYYVLVCQNDQQSKADRKATQERISREQEDGDDTDSARVEGCSCLVGNPCSEGNRYNCKNWSSRFSVAKKNGWKGF